MAHAHTNISRLQETFHRVCFPTSRRQDIPRLWFAAVLARIRSALVCSSQVVEYHGVDRGWAETGQLQVVRSHELIIWSMAPLQRKALCCLTILLLCLLWLRAEEAARGTVFQAVQKCAGMNVQMRLHCPQQESPQQCLPWPLEILIGIHTGQCCVDTHSFCTIVRIVLCVHRGVGNFRCTPTSVVVFWHRLPRPIIAIVHLPAFVPCQYVAMQRLSRLCFSSVPETSNDAQRSLLVACQEVLFHRVRAALK